MTNGKCRMQRRKKAFKKWKQYLCRNPTDLERRIFYTAFGMGWKAGKKRQLQLIKKENENKDIIKNWKGVDGYFGKDNRWRPLKNTTKLTDKEVKQELLKIIMNIWIEYTYNNRNIKK